MNKIKTSFVVSPLLVMVSACGGGSDNGDTDLLKQIVEQNKYNITAIDLYSKITQTYNPVNTKGSTPTFYFANTSDNEQITVTGTSDSGEVIELENVSFEIISNSSTAGDVTINSDGILYFRSLADMVANSVNETTLQASFGGVTSTAKIRISSHSLQSSGLNLYIDDKLVNSIPQTVTVCDETVLAARGVFTDGSTRSITRKVDWTKSISDSNAKFDVSDSNMPFFSANTNALYTLNVKYGLPEVVASVDLNVVQGNFNSMIISATRQTLKKSNSFALTLTANINGVQKNNIESKVKWTTADSNIVTVNTTTGVVTAVNLGGPVQITASCGSEQKTSDITVN